MGEVWSELVCEVCETWLEWVEHDEELVEHGEVWVLVHDGEEWEGDSGEGVAQDLCLYREDCDLLEDVDHGVVHDVDHEDVHDEGHEEVHGGDHCEEGDHGVDDHDVGEEMEMNDDEVCEEVAEDDDPESWVLCCWRIFLVQCTSEL